MKFFFNLMALLVIAVAAVIFAGPYYLFPHPKSESPQVARVAAASDLDEYLRQAEAPFSDDIKAGLQKTILWNDPVTRARTPIAIVYLHGWSASLKDADPMVAILAQRLKANVYFTRLTAHGLKRPEAFEKLTMQNLIDDAREALAIGKRLGQHVVLVGMSTGGTLAVEQAFETREFEEPAAVVLLSPNFMPKRQQGRFITGPFGRLIARAAVGTTYSFQSEGPEHEYAWTTSYPSDGLVPLMDLVNETDSLDLTKVHKPLLVLYTEHDQVLSVPKMIHYYELWNRGSHPVPKEMIDLEGATRHELVGSLFGPRATLNAVNDIVDFVKVAIPLQGSKL